MLLRPLLPPIPKGWLSCKRESLVTKPESDTKPLALNLVQGGLSHSETLIQKVYPWHSLRVNYLFTASCRVPLRLRCRCWDRCHTGSGLPDSTRTERAVVGSRTLTVNARCTGNWCCTSEDRREACCRCATRTRSAARGCSTARSPIRCPRRLWLADTAFGRHRQQGVRSGHRKTGAASARARGSSQRPR